MINRILNLGSAVLLYFSVATVVSILMITTVLWSRGYFAGDRVFQILSVMYGIDMARLRDEQMFSSDRDPTEMASLDEVIAARAIKSLDLDLREQAFEKGVTDLHDMRDQLAEERRRYDLMKRSFDEELTRLKQKSQEESLIELQQTLEAMQPKQAKEQLLKMIKDDAMDDVVSIVKGMALDKRKKVIQEFRNEEEADKLAEILRQFRLGAPEVSTISDAQRQLEQFKPE